MLGYTFSIQTISKSLLSFSTSPLLKTSRSLNLDWVPKVKKDSNEELVKKQPNKVETDNEKSNHISDRNNYDEETEQPVKIKLSVEDKPMNELTNIESKTSDHLEKELVETTTKTNQIDTDLFSNSFSQNDNLGSNFTFKEFQNNLKKRRSFLSKILDELKSTKIEENQITKDILIQCLKNIDEYEKQKGGLKVAAVDALKIFDKNE